MVRADQSIRPVPQVVDDAIKRLQALQSTGSESGVDTALERRALCVSLREYVEVLQRIERSGVLLDDLAPDFASALFTYITSSRTISSFKRFIVSAAMPEELYSVRDEIFSRESPKLFWHAMKLAESPHSSAELHGFAAIISECSQFADLPIAWESVKMLAKLFATGHATEEEFLSYVYDLESRDLIPGSVLRVIAEYLCNDELTLSSEGERVFYLIGSGIVERSGESALRTWGALKSHPVVEFGFLKQRVVSLAPRASSGHEHELLCHYFSRAHTYLDRLDLELIRDGLSSIQSALLGAVTRCEPSAGIVLIKAATAIASLPWGAGIVPLWRECARAPVDDGPSASLVLLKTTLSAKWVAREIRRELRCSEELMTTSTSAADRKRFTGLVQGFYGNLRQILREERLADTPNAHLVRGALRAARTSPQLSRAALKELLNMIGISGINSERFGFICLPGFSKQTRVSRHLLVARELVRRHEEALGWFARWRLRLFDRGIESRSRAA